MHGMLVYPNSMSVPIMINYGVPPPAKGALNVKLLRVEGLKKAGMMYCSMEVGGTLYCLFLVCRVQFICKSSIGRHSARGGQAVRHMNA